MPPVCYLHRHKTADLKADLISKTSFLKFEQCPKAFYFYKRLPQLADQPDVDKKLVFLRGHEVGNFARQLFPGGIDASAGAKDTIEIIERTARLIDGGERVIYEAGFTYNRALVLVDILCRQEDKWYGYEVKSSLKVSGNYIKDAQLQYYVLKNSLPGFEDLFLVTINPGYVLAGEPEARKFFLKRSMKTKAEKNFSWFGHRLSEAALVLERNTVPDVPVGRHCFTPYQCDYFGVCWKGSDSPNSVFNLPAADRNSLLDWHYAGIREIDEIPDHLIRRESLMKIRNAFLSGAPFIDRESIGRFVNSVKRPVAAMDMEIWNPAIPKIEGTKPFEQIPFLVSLFTGSDFMTYFTEGQGDQREEFAQQLLELCAPFATLLVYDKTLEAVVIDTLARRYPHLSERLNALKAKLTDVFDVFLKLYYYHPMFRNNFSLKVISTVLVPEISYPAISSGLEAMSLFNDFRKSANELERETIKTALLDYCNTDSLATFRLYEFLCRTAASQDGEGK
jgi:hypothetical protein